MTQSNEAFDEQVPMLPFEDLIFDPADPERDATRRRRFKRLERTIQSLADFGEDVSLDLQGEVDLSNNPKLVPVNSLVFQNGVEPLLAILPSTERVDIRKLQEHLADTNDEQRLSVQLVAPEMVESICGYPPMSVPPLSHKQGQMRTLVDMSLLQYNDMYMLAGGGHASVTCSMPISTIMKMELTELGDIIVESESESDDETDDDDDGDIRPNGSIINGALNDEWSSCKIKPFFPVAPPEAELAKRYLSSADQPNPRLVPHPLTIVGRVNGVRRMAGRLVFVDLAPPDYIGTGSMTDSYDLPWRSVLDGQDMAVQLIAGKTLCQKYGDVGGPAALKKFKPGQLIMVKGKTNVGNRESVGHWIDKRSLDIVVFDFEILQQRQQAPREQISPNVRVEEAPTNKQSSAELKRLQLTAIVPESSSPKPVNYLTVNDVFQSDGDRQPSIKIVDSLESIQTFTQDIRSLGNMIDSETSPVALVGMDCEWRPSFMMAPGEPQPILLLQISLQKLQTVHLFDMQTLLRPCLDPQTEMNETEQAVSGALSELFSSMQFIKIGFQLSADLRRLASSYPHITAFSIFHSVIEVSAIARKAMQLAKIRNSRQICHSLAKLTQYMLEMPLSKEQQISDWSKRPLSRRQMEYAALDAAVPPSLFVRALSIAGADWLTALRFGRTADDASFVKSLTSFRFLFLDTSDPATVRKLKAKKLVSDLYSVTQSWLTGADEPNLPSVPANNGGGPYTDRDGILRVPALLVSIPTTSPTTPKLIGRRMGRSKDACLEALLEGSAEIPGGGKLEYHQRSGYVEFTDGVALFVNMPKHAGQPSPRGYPNAWRNDGKILTWYLRENEWDQGNSRLAQKLLGSDARAVLFVRMGRNDFLCCGKVRIPSPELATETEVKDWGLVELNIELSDWSALQSCLDFRSMVIKDNDDDSTEFSPTKLATMILKGNMIGAMHAVTVDRPENERNIEGAKRLLVEALTPGPIDEEDGTTTLLLDAMKKVELTKGTS